MANTPAVLVQWDDGLATSYTEGFGYMQVKKIKGTTFSNSPSAMNTTLLAEMYAAGWDVGNHSETHVSLTTLTEAQQQLSLTNCKNYLDGLGFTRASRHVAYPGGYYNADTLTAMASTGMLTGRHITTGQGTVPEMAAAWHELSCFAIWPTTTLAAAKAYVDDLIANKKIGSILFHSVVNFNPVANQWITSDFQRLMDYINQRQLVSLTISQLYGLASAGFEYTNPWYVP